MFQDMTAARESPIFAGRKSSLLFLLLLLTCCSFSSRYFLFFLSLFLFLLGLNSRQIKIIANVVAVSTLKHTHTHSLTDTAQFGHFILTGKWRVISLSRKRKVKRYCRRFCSRINNTLREKERDTQRQGTKWLQT